MDRWITSGNNVCAFEYEQGGGGEREHPQQSDCQRCPVGYRRADADEILEDADREPFPDIREDGVEQRLDR